MRLFMAKAKKMIYGLILFLAFPTLLYANVNSAIGLWKTVDDKTGKVLSIVKIYQVKDGTLAGKIHQIMPVLGQKKTDICTACEEELHNKPMLNLRVIWGMSSDEPQSWIGGRALDPKSGSIYRARMTLEDNGCKLKLRGYIGIPLFGRTQTWIRTGVKSCKE